MGASDRMLFASPTSQQAKAVKTIVPKELCAIVRRQRGQNLRMLDDLPQPQRGDGGEPQHQYIASIRDLYAS